jgi:hypothetical protein
MLFTVPITETTTISINVSPTTIIMPMTYYGPFCDLAKRHIFKYSQTILTVLFVITTCTILSLSPEMSRSLDVVASAADSYPYSSRSYIMPRTKAEEILFSSRMKASGTNDRNLRIGQQQHSKQHSRVITWNATKDIVRPNDDNTALAIVAMDSATDGYIAERCIRSIRARGEFKGYVMLFTDKAGYKKYKYTLSWDPKTIVILGRPEDLTPRKDDGTQIKYRRNNMVYKRFKTLALQYLDLDVRFDRTRYVLYLDVDSIVANKLSHFFDDYYKKMEDDYQAAKRILKTDDFSFFSFWKDPGAKYQLWQGGQIMHDRQHSGRCNDAWRDQMDNVWRGMDQPLLMNVDHNYKKYKCVIFELPGDGRHFDLFHTEIMTAEPIDYPTIVHITSVRVTMYDKGPQQMFIQKALLVDGDDYEKGGRNSMMVGDISWNDVTMPIGAGGIKHES